MTERKELTVKPFKAEDNLELNLRKEDSEYFSSYDKLAVGKILEEKGNAFSFYWNDELVFVGGINIFWPGVGEAWVLCDKCVIRFGKELYYYCDLFIDKIMNEKNLHRVQATPRMTWNIGVRFVEKLGFILEGPLRKYGSLGENHYMYARVK